MRFKNCAPLLPLVGFLLLSGCERTTWKEFSSTEGGFSILMPGTPTPQKQILKTPVGSVNLYMFSLERGSVAYVIHYNDLPFRPHPDDIKGLLDGARNDALAFYGGRLLDERIISLDAFPGREVIIESSYEGTLMLLVMRFYLVNQRFYQVTVTVPKQKDFSEESKKFLDSFRLLKPMRDDF